MATFRYFADINGGTVELVAKSVHYLGRQAFGTPEGHVATFVEGQGWNRGYIKATRVIQYKSNPSRHECDARCMNASGRTMNCECACGGKNHGLGGFRAEAA